MSSILEICQEASSLVATQKPRNLFNENSQQESIFLSVVKDTMESLRRYGDWQELTKEGALITIPGKSVYYIPDFCPDFYSLINNTIYVKDTSEKIIGSITPEQWMRERVFQTASGIQFKIQNNCFRFLNPPAKTVKIVFHYRSAVIAYNTEDPCLDAVEKTVLTANTDVPVFDEYLVKMGIVWRWYKRNGMPYEEELAEYEREVKTKFGSGLATRDIFLGSTPCSFGEGGLLNGVSISN